jgi:Cdc6-like AAA superfamily ATPase
MHTYCAFIANKGKLGSEEYVNCMKSLKYSNYEYYRNEILLKRQDDTCTWLQNHECYKTWVKEDNRPILWISGGPGCGKSVLSAYLSKEVLPNQPNRLPVAYFFCDNKDERLRTAQAIVVDLLAQLLEQLPSIVGHFSAQLKHKPEENTIWDYSMLWQVFERVVNDANTGYLYLLIDALGIQPSSSILVWLAHCPRRMR